MTTPPASPGPKYPIPWVATYFIIGLILIGGSFGLVWYLSQFSSDFDYDDPDMRFLEDIILSDNPRSGDFSKLNGGDWTAFCLVGWKGNPNASLTAAGIGGPLAKTILSAYARRLEEVRETEFLFVYVTKAGVAKALRHPHGFAFARAGKAKCTTKEEPVMPIPVNSK